ncbi:MAG: VWA domain-containing protein [Planctomycetes bacterium]|nr:VWA domain-containing protein [Planctomycetota bacterium]MCB9911335.1 VWA domain-containing protein [Planctomycetota bacterium]
MGSPGTWVGLAALFLGLGAWFAWPGRGQSSLPRLRIVVLDLSASVSRLRRNLAASYWNLALEEAQNARQLGESLCFLRLDDRVEVLLPPTPAAELPEEPLPDAVARLAARADAPLETDWAGLFSQVESLCAPGQSLVVRLVSDGEAPGEDDWNPLWRLAAMGVPVEYLEPPAPNAPDAAICELLGPEEVPPGIPSQLRVTLAWRGPSDEPSLQAGLRVRWTASDGEVHERLWPVALGPVLAAGRWSERTETLDLPGLPAGAYDVGVTIEVPGDRCPENDASRWAHRVGGGSLVLWVGAPAFATAGRSQLAEWRAQGVTVRPCSIEELDRWLPQADVLWTLGVAASELPGPQVEAFVRGGGAWWVQGQRDLLPGWGGPADHAGTLLSDLYPCDVNYGSGDPRDVVLLVDGSGSMQGGAWLQVQKATEVLMQRLPVEDGFALHLFTRDLLPASLEFAGASEGGATQRTLRQRAQRDLLRARVPGGPTDILRSLLAFAASRNSDRPCIAVLITDGWESDAKPRDPASVRAELGARSIDLRIVATGANPNLDFLNRLLLPGEACALAGEMEELEALLEVTVLGDVVRRGSDLSVVPVAPEPGENLGLDTVAPPAGARVPEYLRTRIRPGGKVLWASNYAEPILALREAGLGWVLQSPTDWVGSLWQGGAKLAGDLLLALATRAREAKTERPALRRVGAGVQIQGAGTDPWRLRVRGTGGTWQPLATRELDGPPILDPRSQRWVVGDPGPGTVEIQLEYPNSNRPPVPLVWPGGLPAELLPGATRWPEPPPAPQTAPPPPGGRNHPLAPWFLGIGWVCLLVLVWIRGQGGKESTVSADGG